MSNNSGVVIATPNPSIYQQQGTSIGGATSTIVPFAPYQIAGLVPLTLLNYNECRSWIPRCQINPVFGQLANAGSFPYKTKYVIPNQLLNYFKTHIQQQIYMTSANGDINSSLGLANASLANWIHFLNTLSQADGGGLPYLYTTDGTYLYVQSNSAITFGNMTFRMDGIAGSFVETPTYFGLPFTQTSTYENDWNYFLLNWYVSFNFYIQKFDGFTWNTVINLVDNSYGNQLSYGTVQETYQGYGINWGAVLSAQGTGIYRFMATDSTSPPKIVFVSECFNLMMWDCIRAHGTIKFETTLTGKIGDLNTDYLLYDLAGITVNDSLRLNGFFGYKKAKYNTVVLEYGQPQLGKMIEVRDEQIQSFLLKIKQDTPLWIQERLSVYAFMANDLLVSDYNLNNSDYNIKQLDVKKTGGWEPTYQDQDVRVSGLSMEFGRGVNSIIHSNC